MEVGEEGERSGGLLLGVVAAQPAQMQRGQLPHQLGVPVPQRRDHRGGQSELETEPVDRTRRRGDVIEPEGVFALRVVIGIGFGADCRGDLVRLVALGRPENVFGSGAVLGLVGHRVFLLMDAASRQ
jgi:hypothetical protein